MATFLRYRPILGGFIGAPGINTWHGERDVLPLTESDAQEWADAVRAVYDAMKGLLGYQVQVTFPGEVTEHDEATGALTNVFGVTAPATVTATATSAVGNASRATQLVVHLGTDQIRDGKRLAGRQFIGPVATTTMGSDGQVTSAVRTAVQSAYGGVTDVAGPELVVYGPPKLTGPNAGSPGRKGTVTSVRCLSVPGTLRSRKV